MRARARRRSRGCSRCRLQRRSTTSLYCHATPESNLPITTAITPADAVLATFGDTRGTVVIGHTHHQFDRSIDGLRVVNAGSVGMAYEGEVAAFWTLLDDGEPSFRRTPFDVERAVAETRASALAACAGVRRREPARRASTATRRSSRSRVAGREGPDRQASVGRTGSTARSSSSSRPRTARWWTTGATFLAGGGPVEVVATPHVVRAARDQGSTAGRARHDRWRSSARICRRPTRTSTTRSSSSGSPS